MLQVIVTVLLVPKSHCKQSTISEEKKTTIVVNSQKMWPNCLLYDSKHYTEKELKGNITVYLWNYFEAVLCRHKNVAVSKYETKPVKLYPELVKQYYVF